MKKVLMLASVASMIDQFNMVNIDILQKQGYEVHVAANFKYGNTSSQQRIEEFKKELSELGITYYHIDFARNITKIFTNIKAYKQIRNLMATNKYEFVHCHSPIGGACGRLAAHWTKTKVIYTAHGFHFYKGAPLINWLLYYPVERFLARYTDVLITINKEDYQRAQKFKAGKVVYVPGIGVDIKRFRDVLVDRDKKRNELGISNEAFVILSVGEINKNKNHEVIIRAIAKLNKPHICYIICGQGDREIYLKKLAISLGVANKVKFLGFRNDIAEIYKIADVFVFPSFREGLPVSVMEAMAAGLPIICSNIRGNTDLIENGKGGFLVGTNDIVALTRAIEQLLDNTEKRRFMGITNTETIKKFCLVNIMHEMEVLYK